MTERKGGWRRWMWILMPVAAVWFTVRGPARGLTDAADFARILDSSRCWMEGRNPYLPGDLAACSLDHAEAGEFVDKPQVHPPSAALLLAPFAAMRPDAARICWTILLLGLTLLAGLRLARVMPHWGAEWSCFLLAFAPIHTALRLGQTSLATCGLAALSLTMECSWAAGILLGLGACFKPHLAAGFIALAAWNDGRRFVAAMATCGVITGAAVWHLKAGSIAAWLRAISSLTAMSGPGSGSVLNASSYQLLNVDSLIPPRWYGWNSVVALDVAILVVSGLAAARVKDRWLATAVVATASAIVGYHRFYDATMFCLAIPALLALPPAFRWVRGCFAVFLAPGQAIFARWLGSEITGVWSFVLLRHEVIAGLLIWGGFTYFAMRYASGRVNEMRPVMAREAVAEYPL